MVHTPCLPPLSNASVHFVDSRDRSRTAIESWTLASFTRLVLRRVPCGCASDDAPRAHRGAGPRRGRARAVRPGPHTPATRAPPVRAPPAPVTVLLFLKAKNPLLKGGDRFKRGSRAPRASRDARRRESAAWFVVYVLKSETPTPTTRGLSSFQKHGPLSRTRISKRGVGKRRKRELEKDTNAPRA